MKFHRLKDVSLSPTDFVCRDATWPLALMTLLGVFVFGGVMTAAFVYRAWETAPGPVRYIIAPVWALLTLLWVYIYGQAWLKSLGPQNWLLRVNAQGMWIKFRSFANAHFNDEDDVVIQLDRSDVAWIGSLRECYIRPGAGEGRAVQWEWLKHLQIGLSDGVDLAEIDRRLAEERNRKASGERVRTKVQDYPVRLIDKTILQIAWKSSSRKVQPSIIKALESLSSFAEVRELPEKISELATPASEKVAMESQIIELMERGDQLAAIKLARKCYRCSLTEAKKFVDQLENTNRGAATEHISTR